MKRPKRLFSRCTPVVTSPAHADEEARFNNWIPKGLKRMIKAYGAQNDMSQKDITIQALQNFLKENGNK